jgi:hypothetical protein
MQIYKYYLIGDGTLVGLVVESSVIYLFFFKFCVVNHFKVVWRREPEGKYSVR